MDDDVSKEELSVSLESVSGGVGADAFGVAPGVLAAVILGVLFTVALLFSMACFMDRCRGGAKTGRGSCHRSTKITILDDMSPDPTSDPPAAAAAGVADSLPGTSSEC